MTYRHAMKDADNNVPFGETLPVHYNALAGLTVEETEIRAYGKLSAEELNSYLEMTRKLTAALREETEKLYRESRNESEKRQNSVIRSFYIRGGLFPDSPFSFCPEKTCK